MLRKSEEKNTVRKPGPFGGKGEVTSRDILNGPEEMSGKGRLFRHTTLWPGASLGYHVHQGDGETYYILSGHGIYNDNGTPVEVGPGDVAVCPAGCGHALECVGDEPLDMIALILFE